MKLETMKQAREVSEIKFTQDPENTENDNNNKIKEDMREWCKMSQHCGNINGQNGDINTQYMIYKTPCFISC